MNEQTISSDDLVAVPRGLLGAACHAIKMQVEAPGTFAELRRYTTGDLARSSIVPAASEADIAAKLLDPAIVHQNMLLGKIAKIDMLACAHTHGEDMVKRWRAFEEWERAASEAEPAGMRHACNLWVDPATRNYVVDRCDHPLNECIPAYIAAHGNSRIAGDGEAGAVAKGWRAAIDGLDDFEPSHGAIPCMSRGGDYLLKSDVISALAALEAAPPEKQTSHSEGDAGGIGIPRAPRKCPITKREFWGNLDHPWLGTIATYGGPFDTYTIPAITEEGELRSERYDHDSGEWVEGGEPIGWYYREQQDAAPTVPHSLTVAQGDAVKSVEPAWVDEIFQELQVQFDSEMITENDSGEELVRLEGAKAAVIEAGQRWGAPAAQGGGDAERFAWIAQHYVIAHDNWIDGVLTLELSARPATDRSQKLREAIDAARAQRAGKEGAC